MLELAIAGLSIVGATRREEMPPPPAAPAGTGTGQ